MNEIIEETHTHGDLNEDTYLNDEYDERLINKESAQEESRKNTVSKAVPVIKSHLKEIDSKRVVPQKKSYDLDQNKITITDNPSNPDTGEASLKNQNTYLKQQIEMLSSKIGDYIQTLKLRQATKDNTKHEHIVPSSKEDIQAYVHVQKEISFYRENINKLKIQMEGIYNLSKVESLENELKVKREKLNSLKQEESLLDSIQKSHSKAIEELEDKYENKNEINFIKLKIQGQKEELRAKKDLIKTHEIKLKDLHAQLYSLDVKSKQVKDRIEAYKAHKLKPAAYINENELGQIEESMRALEDKLKSEEKEHKSELIEQQNLINKITEENEFLRLQLKEKQKLNRLNELKTKEIERISKLALHEDKFTHERAVSAKNKLQQPELGNPKQILRINRTPGVASNFTKNPFVSAPIKFSSGKHGLDHGNSAHHLHQPPFLNDKLNEGTVQSRLQSKPKPYAKAGSNKYIPKLSPIKLAHTQAKDLDQIIENQSLNLSGELLDKEKKEKYKSDIFLKIEMLKTEIQDALRDNK